METDLQTRRAVPIGTLILFALAAVLYVAMLANVPFSSGGGEDAFSQAIASFYTVFGLWIVLAVLVVVSAVAGTMPRWSGFAAFVLIPLSGIAAFVAIDMCSRHIPQAIIVLILLPLLIAFCAAWARWPGVRARFPGGDVSMASWGAIFVVSVATFLLAL
jgi:hypothetical protein